MAACCVAVCIVVDVSIVAVVRKASHTIVFMDSCQCAALYIA